MDYFDIEQNWPQLCQHVDAASEILVADFRLYTLGRWNVEFNRTQCPRDFESYPLPRHDYWRYVKFSACHWLVNFNLRLATLAAPEIPWRIVTSDRHSTVWNGPSQNGTKASRSGTVVFDIVYFALGIPAALCLERAFDGGEQLAVGEYAACGYFA